MGRYWCKNCQVFVDDNALSKRHHLDSLKHKSSVQRSINQIHQKNKIENRVKKVEHKSKPKPKEIEVTVQYQEMKEEKETSAVLRAQVSQWKDVIKDQKDEDEDKQDQNQHIQAVHTIIRKTPKNKLSEAVLEVKKWNFDDKKSIQLSDSDDDNQKPSITFKKRKIPKKTTT